MTARARCAAVAVVVAVAAIALVVQGPSPAVVHQPQDASELGARTGWPVLDGVVLHTVTDSLQDRSSGPDARSRFAPVAGLLAATALALAFIVTSASVEQRAARGAIARRGHAPRGPPA